MAERARNQRPSGFFSRLAPLIGLTAAGSPLVEPKLSPGRPRRTPAPPGEPAASSATPDAIRALTLEWQKEIIAMSDAVPVVAGACALVRSSVQRTEWIVENGNAAQRARAQARIDALDKERMLELIWLSGESYVAWPDDPGAPIPVEEVPAPFSLSVTEFKPRSSDGANDQMQDPRGAWVDMIDEHGNAIPFLRIWRPSKANRWQASSPNRAALEVIRAMYLSQRVDTATQRSRLQHAGIMFWPTDAPDVPTEDGAEPEPGSQQDLLDAFEHASRQVVDMHAKGQEPVTPFVVFYDPGPDGAAYKPEMFRVERDDLAAQYATRTDTYNSQYALAAELPVESVTGMGGTNHWSAWQIDVDKWKTWFAPLCELARSVLEKEVVKLYGEGLTLVVKPGELVAKPDQTDTIVKLAMLEIVTPDSVQDALLDQDLSLLKMKDYPVRPAGASKTAPGQPSDFAQGNGDRGGGAFRDQP